MVETLLEEEENQGDNYSAVYSSFTHRDLRLDVSGYLLAMGLLGFWAEFDVDSFWRNAHDFSLDCWAQLGNSNIGSVPQHPY